MKEEKTLPQALNSIFMGYLLLHLHVNLGRLDILPDWAGYLALLSALPALTKEEPSAALLKPLAVGLALWNGFAWAVKILGDSVEIPVLPLVVSIVALYFHFQFLTDVMIAAEHHGLPQAARIGQLRTWRTVIMTAAALPLDWGEHLWVVSALAIAAFLVTAALCLELNAMRKALDP